MKTINDCTFFYGGEFSQWHMSVFTEKGISYCCAEQYMMAWKARIFQDDDAYTKIMGTCNPKEMQTIGRTIKNFNQETWDLQKFNVVARANYLKFTQNPRLKEMLRATKRSILVEASPVDRVWGIGMHIDDPNINDFNKWRGENLLGKAIMSARSRIYDEGL